MYGKETCEEVIWDLIEGTVELEGETKKNITQARQDIREGKYYTLEEVKRELGLWFTFMFYQ